jgi:purine catabolism regulator
LTVRGLISLPQLGLTVKAGATGLDREIRLSHAIELDDPTPWLAGGELILITGWQKSADDPSWTDYIERVDGAGAAALGFGGLAHPEPPPALTASAERHWFPLISVPLPVPFIAVIRAVTDRLAEDGMADIRTAIDRLSRIVRTAAEKGVTGVVADLARLVDGAVVVTDANLNVQAAEPPDATALIARMTQELGQRPQRWRGRVGASVSDAAGQLTVQSVVPATGPPGTSRSPRPRRWNQCSGSC